MQAWTTLKLLEWTAEYFEKKGVPNARLDAELLLAACLGCERIDLYTQHNKPVQLKELDQFRPLVERRATREPLQYILGHTEFHGHHIQLNSEVLIPRPETELLVEKAIEVVETDGNNMAEFGILDLGTGSACIAIALAKHIEDAHVTATDRSAPALATAQTNIRAHELEQQIELFKADLFPEFLGKGAEHPYFLVVSNPPYVPTAELDQLQPEVSQYEPRAALDGGEDGLELYRRIATGLKTWLAPAGSFVGEIGDGQADTVRQLFEKQDWCEKVEIVQDLNERPRIVIAKRRP